jgi:ubiquinone/menaquinone biosynthesis C-methylase UbiE
MTKTSWGSVAGWYDDLLSSNNTFQSEVIFPNLQRLMGSLKDKDVLDLACGQGFFAIGFAKAGGRVTGIDISPELIALAEEHAKGVAGARFLVAPANALEVIPDDSQDVAVCVLALQNIADVHGVCKEMARVLRVGGSFHFVLNHPSFRVPKNSSWEWDEEAGQQFRRVDAYMTELKVKIAMHPGKKNSPETVSFHRPLQFFVKALAKQGFVISGMEEWLSHKNSDSGPRAEEENRIRREIPMFMYIKAEKR